MNKPRLPAVNKPGTTTGRHIIVFRSGGLSEGVTLLEGMGLRIARTDDNQHRGFAEDDARDAHVIVLPNLEMALLAGDTDHAAILERLTAFHNRQSPIQYLTEETVVRSAQSLPVVPGLANNAIPVDWNLRVTRTLDSSFTGRGIRVAVLDTGLDLDHPDFSNRIPAAHTSSFVSGAPTVDDDNGHGTHCAGIVAGPSVPTSGQRYGTAPDVELLIGKVLNFQMIGAQFWVLQGIDWAVGHRCQIVSLSLGEPVAIGMPFQHEYEEHAQRALALGTLIVAAAGNNSNRPFLIQPVASPADCPSVLAVGGLTSDLSPAIFSNRGINPQGGLVDVAAPGVEIFSSWRGGSYARLSGTSQGAALVAGIAALFSEASGATGVSLWQQISASTTGLPQPQSDVGRGLVTAPV